LGKYGVGSEGANDLAIACEAMHGQGRVGQYGVLPWGFACWWLLLVMIYVI
jgi:hypothetical protein